MAPPTTKATGTTNGTTAAPTTGAPPTRAARRTPTTAEINQVISTIHGLLPIYTPTKAEIDAIGDKVCSAFDQGQSFSLVKSSFLTIIGAGAYSALIPASVPDTAVRTMVGLYCPGYGSKLV